MISYKLLKTLKVRITQVLEDYDSHSRPLKHFTAEAYFMKYSNGEEKEVVIATIDAYKVYYSNYSFYLFDAESSGMMSIAEGIEQYNKSGSLECSELINYVAIDRILVEKKYRNKGVGKFLLSSFIANTTKMGDGVFLYSCPFEKDESETEEVKEQKFERLKNYYKKLGFSEIEDSGVLFFEGGYVLSSGKIDELIDY